MALHLTSVLLALSTQFDIDRGFKKSRHRDLNVRFSKSEESERLDEMRHTGMGNWF